MDSAVTTIASAGADDFVETFDSQAREHGPSHWRYLKQSVLSRAREMQDRSLPDPASLPPGAVRGSPVRGMGRLECQFGAYFHPLRRCPDAQRGPQSYLQSNPGIRGDKRWGRPLAASRSWGKLHRPIDTSRAVFAKPAPTSLALAAVTPNRGTGALVDDFRDRRLRTRARLRRSPCHDAGRRPEVSSPLPDLKSSRLTSP